LAASTHAETLERAKQRYVDAQRPDTGQSARDDFSARSFHAEIEAWQGELTLLRSVEVTGLSKEQDIDRRLLIGIYSADINTAKTLRRWENNPAIYLPGGQLSELLESGVSGDDTPDREKLLDLFTELPKRLADGQSNLKHPPKRFTESAVFQAENRLATLDEGLAGIPAQDGELASVAAKARQALADYLAFIKNDLLPRSDGSWMLGREAYDFVLQKRWHMDSDADRIHQRGLLAFEETEAHIRETAERLQPRKHWTEVYESLQDNHPTSGELKQAYQAQMDRAQAFVRERSILTLPEGERVITLDTPPAMRRSSPFGTFEMVSPFDDGLEGRLMLTPIEGWMTPEQQAQRLRAHHDAWIPVIAVHEAYPGHHAHGIKLKENPNLLRRVVHESIFTEGWGLFTEELMYEQGFLVGDAVRLTVLRNRLWRAARVVLDSGLHTGRMSFEDAVQFLVEKVRFDPYAAELEVGMYIREPTYVLGYMIGMQEIEALRAEYIRRHGEPNPPSLFYDRLLSVGSIPPALAREALFD
jgi:uncharacterized protein (DUF885 family)